MKYILRYSGKTIVRHAETAEAAVEKLCDQYGWRCHLRLYDADTRGGEWAECDVDTNGGINWDLVILAKKGKPLKEKVIFRKMKNPYITEQQYLAVFPDEKCGPVKVGALPFYFSHDDMDSGTVWFEPYTEIDISYLYRSTKIVHKDDERSSHLLRTVEEYTGEKYRIAEKII